MEGIFHNEFDILDATILTINNNQLNTNQNRQIDPKLGAKCENGPEQV